MPQQTREIARQLAGYFGVPTCEKFVRGFVQEVRLIDPAGNDENCASELANTVFVEVAEQQASVVTEADLQRALWRVSKEWQRGLKRFRESEQDYPDQKTNPVEPDLQTREAIEEVFNCLNELPEESYTLLIGIMDGMSIEDAAKQAEIPRATAYRWIKKIRSQSR